MTLTAADRIALLGEAGVVAARAEGADAPPMSPELVETLGLIFRQARAARDDPAPPSTTTAAA